MQYIGFTMNNNEYTIPILKVQEIVNMPHLTKLPQVPHYIEGVTNLRGRIIPIVNLKKLVGLGGDSVGEKVIVVTSGRITFGVLIDSITGVITIEDSEIEPPADFNTSDIVSGVAKVGDKLIVLLDTKKLIPMEDMSIFEDEIFEVSDVKEVKDEGGQVEVVREVEETRQERLVNEALGAMNLLTRQGMDPSDPRYALFDEMIGFMSAISNQDYDKADISIQSIMKKGQNNLFREVGKVTRKLHDSIRSFKEALDPRLKDMAVSEMPNAVDQLQFVIEKTEDAANKTMGIVEKYILIMDELASHIRNLKEPEESVQYLKKFKTEFEDDLTEILTTQSFQDITGQTIKKVIKLVGDIEEELVKLITTFGVKMEQGAIVDVAVPEKVSQEDVNDLLKDFGF
jgi:chemotaxis signal transduction protein/chemotaxis regulatin CheY-phosphate phosphatase CheZ